MAKHITLSHWELFSTNVYLVARHSKVQKERDEKHWNLEPVDSVDGRHQPRKVQWSMWTEKSAVVNVNGEKCHG